MVKLLAVDMDGTCLTDKKKISERTMSALKQAANNGIIVVPITGRSLDCLPRQLINETFYCYVVLSNGARIFDVQNKKTLYSALIPQKNAISLLLEGKKCGLGLTAHVDNQNIVEGFMLNLKGRLIYKKDTADAIKTKNIVETVKAINGDVEEIQFFFFNEKAAQSARYIVKANNFTASFGRFYVEVYSKDTSKGIALRTLADILGISKNEIMSIGNGENDLTMFEESGTKIAVENAEPCLKAKADFVVASNNADGVAEAIEKFCL